MKNIIKKILPILVILILWQIVYSSNIWSEYVLPSPQKVWISFLKMLNSGELVKHIYISFIRVIIGFFIAFISAFILAFFASVKPKGQKYYGHLLEFMRNVPPLSLIALLILWFGIGEISKIVIIILATFFPIYLNIKKGFICCDEKLLEVGNVFGFSKQKKFLKIILPNAIPDILIGMKVGMGYSWRAIIGAEMIAASSGLGYLILDAQQMSRSDKVIVGIIVIGIVGIICDKLFSLIIKKILKGGEKYASY